MMLSAISKVGFESTRKTNNGDQVATRLCDPTTYVLRSRRESVVKSIGPNWIHFPVARIRRRIEVNQGVVRAFTMQLEYNLEPRPERREVWQWTPVARFDHNAAPTDGHDIREEGLHMDLYRNGEKDTVYTDFPKVPLNQAPDFCESFLEKNSERYLAWFERDHDIVPGYFSSP